jgi:tripartite-type tricarboxylate transporter receptor subunit TctC
MLKLRLVVALVALFAASATVMAQDWEINKALAESAVRDGFLQSGQEPVGGSAETFARLVRGDFDTYARLVKELNIKSE